MTQQGFSTRQIHAGHKPDPTTGAAVLPLYQTTSYVFDSCDQAAQRFALKEPGHIYTRLNNPTNDLIENRIANLEGGAAALVTSSGAGAIATALLTIGHTGDNVIASPSLYGGTKAFLANTLPRYGITTRFVDTPNNPDDWRALADDRTIAFFGETIPNPKNDVFDIETIANTAHDLGVPLIVDNTVPTPYLTRPIEWGADIVIHSVTKYLAGHGTSVIGAIVDGGTFDWSKEPTRFAQFNEPDPSYHGLVYSTLGPTAFITKARVQILRDFGFAASPFNAFLALFGIETLSLRLQRHSDNALAVARYLESHPYVTKVSYAGLESSPYYELAQKYAPKGASGIVSFDIKGGRPAGQRFVDALKLHLNLVNIGDVRSLVSHPASTTHSQSDEDGLAASGITEGTIRLSVGLEDPEDIIADLDQAFHAALPTTTPTD
ncbi:MAG: PLP-dependent transferase [Actinomycetaceae bacterium]|nr:PLP-dependent transferase [Actinomycetaceae bacterium]